MTTHPQPFIVNAPNDFALCDVCHQTEADDYFGLCPVCHKTDGYINIGRGHWFYCSEHKKCWMAGSNQFSSWKFETEEEQRAQYDELGFGDFEDIESYTHEKPCPSCGQPMNHWRTIPCNDCESKTENPNAPDPNAEDPWATPRAADCLKCGKSSLKAFPPDEAPTHGYICYHCTEQLTVEEAQRLIADAKEIKDHLSKPLVERLQLDGWANYPEGDSIMRPDEDGDVTFAGNTRERHRSGTTVRIWIDPDADKDSVVRLLAKLVEWYRVDQHGTLAELLDPDAPCPF